MPNPRPFALGLAATFGLNGCALMDPRGGYSVETDPATLVASTQSMQTALTRKDSNGVATGWVDAKCFAVPAAEADRADCKLQRNHMLAMLVIASENACLAHRRSMYGNEAMTNIGLGTATNLFSGMAAVLSESQPARAARYAAIALFANSERSLANETVYKMMLVTAIDKKINEVRDRKAQELHTRTEQDLASYGVGQALQDWSSFHASCSFMSGLRLALDEGTQGGNAQKMMRLKQSLRDARAESATLKCPGASTLAPAPAPAPASAPVPGPAPATAPGPASAPAPAPAASQGTNSDCSAVGERIKALNQELGTLERQ